MPRSRSDASPLSDEEILRVLDASGYPLEIEIFEKFKKADMDPLLGLRFRTRDVAGGKGDYLTREIDIKASKQVIRSSEGGLASITLGVLVDAKKLHEPKIFVGVLGDQPSQHDMRVYRCRVGGLPAYHFADEADPLKTPYFIGDGGLSSALEPFCAVPFCVQWAIVGQRKSDDYPTAYHDDGFWDGMVTLVAATLHRMRSASEFLLSCGERAAKS